MRPTTVPAGSILCWLSLGSPSIQKTRSQSTFFNGQNGITYYSGLGAYLTPTAAGYYVIDVRTFRLFLQWPYMCR
jgi:hypothetical protein